MKSSRSWRRSGWFGVAVVAVLGTMTWAARRSRSPHPVPLHEGDVVDFGGPKGHFSYMPGTGEIVLSSDDGRSRLELEASLVVDGVERALALQEGAALRDAQSLDLSFPIDIVTPRADAATEAAVAEGGERTQARLVLRVDPSNDRLDATLDVEDPPAAAPHTFELRLGFPADARTIFVPNVGVLGDLGKVDARSVVADDDVHPFAFVAPDHGLSVTERPPDVDGQGKKPRIVVSVPADRDATGDGGANVSRMHVGFLVGASNQAVWARVYEVLRVETAKVFGVVTGSRSRARVVALSDEGRPQARFSVDEDGRFDVLVPKTTTTWYATLDGSASSIPVRFAPGTPYPLKLDISPGGELRVKVIDADTGEPAIARLLVKGEEGTVDPSFGPDYRASGAGPLMDMLEGTVTTPLPAGRYRVSATRGIEWSIDAEHVVVESGRTINVDLELRHVVPTPGLVACDLHVHARPSFDSPVTVEDRVLSLASAGIDFAVPSEHNIVGDYGEASEFLGLGRDFAHVTGIEITTYAPRFGHFGIFPYPKSAPVPPFRSTNAAALFAFAHRGDPKRIVQVNHPRLESGIGYFSAAGFDPKKGRWPANMAPDFDTLEVYNGYESMDRPRVERVMKDWFAILNLGRRYAATGSSDSHRIQYQWAGYPRTFAILDPTQAGDTDKPIDTDAVVAALKRGRSFVTSGPMIDFEIDPDAAPSRPKGPGEALRWNGGPLLAHLRLRAAPWIDVTSLELIAGVPAPSPSAPSAQAPGSSAANPPVGTTRVVFSAAIPSRSTYLGKEDGTREEVEARTVRYEGDVQLDLPPGARWVVAVARGDRPMDDALPFMSIQPLAFTNPVWLEP